MNSDLSNNSLAIDIVVMLIDDQAIVGKLVQQALADYEEINFHYCHKAKHAINEITSIKPTVILLDLFMPEINGIELLKQLRSNPSSQDIPVIMLSVEEEAESKKLAFENGANDYIIKLPDVIELVARLRYHSQAYINKIQRDRAFEALRNAQSSLEKKNIELHTTHEKLRKQNQELIETAKTRELVEHISRHDLKTPLNSILGFSQLLLDNDLSTETKECIRYIETAGYQALDMINRTLDLYKMEQGTYQFRPVVIDLVKITSQIITKLQPYTDRQQVSIQLLLNNQPIQKTDYFAVYGEVGLCRSMLENLLKNALEASPTGKQIDVFLQKDQLMGTIKIRNIGEVPKSIRNNFFDKYVTANKEYGTGLGTYSALLNVKTQNGRIELDCSEKGMTSVIIYLPCTNASINNTSLSDLSF